MIPAVALAVAAPAPPRPISPAEAPPSVYRNPRIATVYLRAHEDADGKLLGPQVMYQIVDPGGWNLEALDHGEGAAGSADPAARPRWNGPALVPARGAAPVVPNDPLLDPGLAARIVITGLMRREEAPQAAAAARQQDGEMAAVYDEQAGWLLVPAARRR